MWGADFVLYTIVIFRSRGLLPLHHKSCDILSGGGGGGGGGGGWIKARSKPRSTHVPNLTDE